MVLCRVWIAVAFVTVFATGCGGSQTGQRQVSVAGIDPPATTSDPPATATVPPVATSPSGPISLFEMLRERVGIGDILWSYSSLTAAMPNDEYVDEENGRVLTFGDLYVVGSVKDLQADASFAYSIEVGEEQVTEISFGSRKAEFSTINIRVQTDRFISNDRIIDDVPEEITVVVVLNHVPLNVDAIRAELRGYDRLVFLLARWRLGDGPVNSRWHPLAQGAAIGIVHADDTVEFPALVDSSIVPESLTLAELESPEASEPIPVRRRPSGHYVRVQG